MRKEAATLAFRAKVLANKVQLLGDWQSEANKRYLNFSLQGKIEVSKVFRDHIT